MRFKIQILIFLVLSSMACTSKNSVKWKEVHIQGMHLSYPETWEIDSSGTARTVIVFNAPDPAKKGRKENVNISIRTLGERTADELLTSELHKFEQAMKSFRIIESAGNKAVFEFGNSNQMAKMQHTVFQKNGNVYFASYLADRDAYEHDLETAERIIKSLVID